MEPDNRNQMRFPYPGNNVVLCQGMCGQMIYVNRAVEAVAAKLSTQLDSHEPHMLETLRAFDAVADELAGIASQSIGFTRSMSVPLPTQQPRGGFGRDRNRAGEKRSTADSESDQRQLARADAIPNSESSAHREKYSAEQDFDGLPHARFLCARVSRRLVALCGPGFSERLKGEVNSARHHDQTDDWQRCRSTVAVRRRIERHHGPADLPCDGQPHENEQAPFRS